MLIATVALETRLVIGVENEDKKTVEVTTEE